jgi:hypothetical protein
MGVWLRLELQRLLPRILGLLAFGALFLAAAATARLFAGSDGHVEFDRLMGVGGYPLVSALLLTGWLVGRFPLIAVIVLSAGVFSRDRDSGFARLVATRARAPLLLFFLRVLLALLMAGALSALVLPAFDVLMLGRLPGSQLLALVLGYVLVFGALTALLSTLTRADGWIALFAAIAAIVWHALLRAGAVVAAAPGPRGLLTALLPPQGALAQLETAFAADEAVPGFALVYCATYAALALVLAGVAAARREL